MSYTTNRLAMKMYKLAGGEPTEFTKHWGHVNKRVMGVPNKFKVQVNDHTIQRTVNWIDKGFDIWESNWYINGKEVGVEKVEQFVKQLNKGEE